MKHQIFAPPLELKELVECFWCLESNHNETVPQQYYLMADSYSEIIFQYNEGFKNFSAQSARIRFQHSIHNHYNVADKLGFFGVRLFPHAVKQLLNIPANEVVNEVFDFCSTFKQEGYDLADKIYNAKTVYERIDLISAFLVKKGNRDKKDNIEILVNKVLRNQGSVDIASLQQDSGLSVRQFERRFAAIAGFTPKYFARIARFQAIKDSYSAKRYKTMSALTYSGAYFDQSHFNREFKEFSGVQPLQYFKPGHRDISNHNATSSDAGSLNHFEGYLPCGWFV